MSINNHQTESDDSLFNDDFEIIVNDVQTLTDDLNNPSLVLPTMTLAVEPTSIVISSLSQFPSAVDPQHNDANGIQESAQETRILGDDTITNTTVLPPSLVQSDNSGSLGSFTDATLESMLKSQNETGSILQKTLESFTLMEKEREEMRNRIDSLERENTRVSGELTVIKGTLTSNQAESSDIAELKKQIAELKTKNDGLQQSLYERGLEVDTLKVTNLELTNKVAASEREMFNIKPTSSNFEKSSDFDGIHELRQKLDNMYAQLLDADDRRLLAEDALQQIRNEQGGAFSQTPTEGMIRELREKTDRIKQMQAELTLLRTAKDKAEGALSARSIDVQDKDAIIKILKEDHTESTRLLADRDHRISSLESILQRQYNYLEVNNV